MLSFLFLDFYLSAWLSWQAPGLLSNIPNVDMVLSILLDKGHLIMMRKKRIVKIQCHCLGEDDPWGKTNVGWKILKNLAQTLLEITSQSTHNVQRAEMERLCLLEGLNMGKDVPWKKDKNVRKKAWVRTRSAGERMIHYWAKHWYVANPNKELSSHF